MGVSTFFGLNIGVNALDALQEAQGVVSNNIANSNTPGYVQESTTFGESIPLPPPGEDTLPGQVGQGVDVQSVQRDTNAFVDHQDRVNQGASQLFSTHSNILDQVQAILNEPSDHSIQTALDQFFTAWQTLATDPSNTAARGSVLAQAQTLSQTYQTVTSQLEQLQTNLETVVYGGQPQYTLANTGTIDEVQLLNPQTSGSYSLAYSGTGASLTLQLYDAANNPVGSAVSVNSTGTVTIGVSGSGPMFAVDVASLTGASTLSLVPSNGYYTDTIGTASLSGTSITPTQSLLNGSAQMLYAQTPPEDQYQVQFTALGTTGTPVYSVQLYDATTGSTVGAAVTTTSAGPLTIGSGTAQFSITLATLSGVYSGSLASGTSYVQTDNLNAPSPGGQVGELNSYAAQVYQLNKQIVNVIQSGESPNTLLDQRDVLLDKMSNMANIQYNLNSDNSVSVTLGKVTLVSGISGSTPLTYSDLSGMVNMSTTSGSWDISSGSMTGNLQGIQDTQKLLGQFNSFLNSFAGQVNAVQGQGYPLTGTAQPQMFHVNTDSSGNVSLTVPSSMTADAVAASDQPNQPGNNNNALAMVNLQSANVYQGGSFDQGVAKIVAQVGVEANAVQASQKTADALTQQSTTLRQSTSGVDINQQAALMVQYQNSYSAAAKFISVFDQMLQTLINMVP